MKLTILYVTVVCSFVMPIMGNHIKSKTYDDIVAPNQNHIIETINDSVDERSSSLEQQQQQQRQQETTSQIDENLLSYVKTSIPTRIFKCMQRLNILKCMKIFILQRMERTPHYVNSGNITVDFLDQLLSISPNDEGNDSVHDDTNDTFYLQMNEIELNERLLKSFQRFFHNREIKLHFIPGMVVKVVPNEMNAINLTLKRGKNIFYIFHIENKYKTFNYNFHKKHKTVVHSCVMLLKWKFCLFGSLENTWLEPTIGRAKKRPAEMVMQMGMPAVLMPVILMGTILPFILPAIKFATIFSGLINHAALISALAYVAKQTAFSAESIKHLYYNPGYRRSA